MARFSVQELGPKTWSDFAQIVKKHNGVWGGCWCTGFRSEEKAWSGRHRELKERLVMARQTHNALVFDGDKAVGWCLFGHPAEIPGRMSSYGRLGLDLPDWRIPCFFVDRDRRRDGVAKAALAGALRIIASQGGGAVDGYPIDTKGKPYGSSFLWGGSKSMFVEAGFSQIGRLGTSKLVMRKVVRGKRKS